MVPEGTYNLEPKPSSQMDPGNENVKAPDNWNGYTMEGKGGTEYPVGTPSVTASGRAPGNVPGNVSPNIPNVRVHGPGDSKACIATDKANDIRKMMNRNPGKTKVEIKNVPCKCVDSKEIPAEDP